MTAAIVGVDTNVLVRAAVGDHPSQSAHARPALGAAASIVVTVTSLCEFVWVLERSYRFDQPAIARSIRSLLGAPNVRTDRDLVAAGLRQLDRGGDFADRVIAASAIALGARGMVTFNSGASALWQRDGIETVLLPPT